MVGCSMAFPGWVAKRSVLCFGASFGCTLDWKLFQSSICRQGAQPWLKSSPNCSLWGPGAANIVQKDGKIFALLVCHRTLASRSASAWLALKGIKSLTGPRSANATRPSLQHLRQAGPAYRGHCAAAHCCAMIAPARRRDCAADATATVEEQMRRRRSRAQRETR